VEVSTKGVGQGTPVVVPLPARLGWGRAGDPRGALREIAQSRGKSWQLQTLKAILVFLSLGRWSRQGTSWEIMKEQGRVWAAI